MDGRRRAPAALRAEYRSTQKGTGTAPATVNRDVCALAAFWSWCEAEAGYRVDRPAMAKEREPERAGALAFGR
jgi:hypothetical protein